MTTMTLFCLSVLLFFSFTTAFQSSLIAQSRRPTLQSTTLDENEQDEALFLPMTTSDGIYDIADALEFDALIQHAETCVIKFYSPQCRACKKLEPKFVQLHSEFNSNDDDTVEFAQVATLHNKALFQELNIRALPTVQIYVKGKLHSSLKCLPSNVPVLKEQLQQLVLSKQREGPATPPPRRDVNDYIDFIQSRQAKSGGVV